MNRSTALGLALLGAVLALNAYRATHFAFQYYPYLKLHGDEVQTTREALLYRHVGRGQSLNYVYGGGFPTVLSLLLRFTPPGRLSLDAALALAKQSAPIFHIWGRLLSLVWSLIALGAIYLACRAVAPPPIAALAAAVPCAGVEFLLRSAGCLIDMQAIALCAISTAALLAYAARPSPLALALGAAAFGAAVSTKYNAAFLAAGWLCAFLSTSAPRATHAVRFAAVALIAFFALSPQIALHPRDAVAGILYEARHQRSSFTASQTLAPFLWIFQLGAQPGECGVWLMTLAALPALRDPALRPAAVAFLADLVLVANGGFQSLHYLLPSAACGLACVAGLATGPFRHPARLALLLVLLAGAHAIRLDMLDRARPDTRVLLRERLHRLLPPGSRVLLAAPPQDEPELPLEAIPLRRYKPGGHGADIWLTAAELLALDPDAIVFTPDLLQYLTLVCDAARQPDTPYHRERAALSAFWPPTRWREALRVSPSATTRGPEYILLVR